MIEEFIVHYVPQRVKERGFQNYRIIYRDLNIGPKEKKELKAYNEIWFLVFASEGVRISSDYGEFDYANPQLEENMHEHGDRITITNQSDTVKQAKFIQVLLLEA